MACVLELAIDTAVRNESMKPCTVTVVDDATATFERRRPDATHYSADRMHRVELAGIHGEFATVRSAPAIHAAVDA